MKRLQGKKASCNKRVRCLVPSQPHTLINLSKHPAAMPADTAEALFCPCRLQKSRLPHQLKSKNSRAKLLYNEFDKRCAGMCCQLIICTSHLYVRRSYMYIIGYLCWISTRSPMD